MTNNEQIIDKKPIYLAKYTIKWYKMLYKTK